MTLKLKKLLLIAIAIMILAIGIIGMIRLNKNDYTFWNDNKIDVKVIEPLSISKIKIEFGMSANDINQSNDTYFFSDKGKYQTLYDKQKIRDIPNEYGENDFLITYENQYYIAFRHFKTNCNHQHDYTFQFYKSGNDIFIKTEIVGQDEMKFDIKMNPIANAEQLKMNGTIDSNKVNFNMIEMVNPEKK